MDQGLESLPMSENADRVVMLGDGIAQRMHPTMYKIQVKNKIEMN